MLDSVYIYIYIYIYIISYYTLGDKFRNNYLGDFAEVNCGYSSSGNVLTLEFTSDETTTSSGFRAKANILKSQSSTPGIYYMHVASPSQYNYVLSGVHEYKTRQNNDVRN